MSALALFAIQRPESWNFPLFVHVFGAMVLVGGLLTGAGTLAYARGDVRLLKLGYWSLLAISLPGWVIMRLGADWIFNKEGWDDLPDDALPDWIGIGRLFADVGGLVFLVTLVVGGIGVNRLRQGRGAGLLRATLWLALILLAAYVVAVWAMAGKPN